MIILSAILMALAVWVWMGSTGRHRLPASRGSKPVIRTRSLPLLPAVAVMSVAVTLMVGGFLGLVLGLACWFAVPSLLRRLEPGATRRRRQDLQRQSPEAVDLLAAIIACGSTPQQALQVVAGALGPPVGEDLHQVVRMLDLGATPEQAWEALPGDHPLTPVGRAFRRSAGSGAALHHVLATVAEDLRRRRRIEIEVAARSAGVRAVGPLAACFLPAFVLVGIVPVIASFASRLL
ncbi:MAG: type II secretion system F family protein [Actinomycetales bacterium]